MEAEREGITKEHGYAAVKSLEDQNSHCTKHYRKRPAEIAWMSEQRSANTAILELCFDVFLHQYSETFPPSTNLMLQSAQFRHDRHQARIHTLDPYFLPHFDFRALVGKGFIHLVMGWQLWT